MTTVATQSNVENSVEVVTEVKRGRGRPSLDAATKAKKQVERLMPLLANRNNSNPLLVAQKGIRHESSFRFEAVKMVKEANGDTVKIDSYGVRKSAKTLADAIANATVKSNNYAMAIIVFEARRAGNVANDETKAFLKRISAKGATFTAEEVPEQLKQFL